MRRTQLLLGPLVLALAGEAAAEVVTDGSVGPRGALPGPEFAIKAELGARAGDNLFHSFERFSLAAGERATFSGPPAIENVIARVTGGAPSSIDGALRSTIAGADLYFINPAGVLFGPNATLDVPGSFHVSTADELRFADGEVFSAHLPDASSFSVAAPEAFGFLGGAAAIAVQGSQLALPDVGRTLSLSGGRLAVGNGSALVASNIALAAEASAGAVPLSLGVPAEARSGPVALGSNAPGAPASIASTGNLRIEAGALRIANAVVGDVNVAPTDSTGGVDVAAERLVISNDNLAPGSSIGLVTFSLSTGRAGDLRVVASEVTVRGGLIASAPTQADGGRIAIEADRILLAGNGAATGAIGAPTGAFGAGASGGVTITAHESLTIGAGGQINTASLGERPAGSVVIDLDDSAALIMQPGSLIEATARGLGDGGDIVIRGGDITITGGVVSAETFERGGGGTIDIDTGQLILNDGFVGANVREAARGDAGPVMIKAERLEIRNEGRIFNGTAGIGNGGNVTVVTGTLLIDGTLDHDANFNTGIAASAQQDSSGRSGAVTVSADGALVLSNRGEIASGTQGAGAAGNVAVSGRSIALRDGGRIESASSGSANAGNVAVTARDELTLDRSEITTAARQAGGGRITIQVGELIDLRHSEITTSVSGGAATTAGDIAIDPHFLVLDQSRIIAQAAEGRGGNIAIDADNLILSPDSLISASAGPAGIDGTVATSEPEVDLASSLVVLDAGLLNADALLRERCAARRDVGASSFTGTGRGGLPPSPDQPLGSAYRPPAEAATVRPAALALEIPCPSGS